MFISSFIMNIFVSFTAVIYHSFIIGTIFYMCYYIDRITSNWGLIKYIFQNISFFMLHDGIWFHLRIENVFGMIWNSNQTIQEEHYKKSRKWWFDLTCVVWYQHRKLFWTLRAWLPLSIVCIQIIIFVYLMRYMFSSNHYSI